MLEALNRLDIAITADDVRAANPGTAAVGRPHVADALVAMNVVETASDAFERYLKAGRPAYVDRYAAPLADMIGIVAGAGGVSVVAHPWARLGPVACPRTTWRSWPSPASRVSRSTTSTTTRPPATGYALSPVIST